MTILAEPVTGGAFEHKEINDRYPHQKTTGNSEIPAGIHRIQGVRKANQEMKMPETLKSRISSEGDRFVESALKPEHIKQPPADSRFNYLADIHTKWRGSCFYFISRYNCPGPQAISPSFDAPFARMKYVGGNLFDLSYMRHTGRWEVGFHGLTWKECFDIIESIPAFQP